MAKQLTLPSRIDGPGQARRWVEARLIEIGRPDLVETATLGVSELVTNALLHAGGGIAVRISDTHGRLRVEVYDGSPTAPERSSTIGTEPDTNISTVGHGLQILEAISLAWGVYNEQTGKCVWFQPAAAGLPVRSGLGPVVGSQHETASSAPREHDVAVDLLDLPVVLFSYYRSRLHDLRRELTLITLDDGETSAAGRLLIEAARQQEHRAHHDDMIGHIDDAVAVGLDRADVHLDLPQSVLPELELLRDVMVELHDFSLARQLLTLAPGPQERAIWDWYFGELLGQALGATPTPWSGEFHVTDPDPLT